MSKIRWLVIFNFDIWCHMLCRLLRRSSSTTYGAVWLVIFNFDIWRHMLCRLLHIRVYCCFASRENGIPLCFVCDITQCAALLYSQSMILPHELGSQQQNQQCWDTLSYHTMFECYLCERNNFDSQRALTVHVKACTVW